jgi:hypothetical protein
MSEILNCSIDTIAPIGNIMLYLGTGVVLLSIFYLLIYLSGIGKENIWNESYSNLVKNFLPVFIRNGFLMILSGLIIGAILLFLEWNKVLFLLPIVLFVIGLIELFVAWHIRQGLLYVGFVRLAVGILNLPRSTYWLFLFQLLFWIVLFVCWIKYSDFQLICIAGCTLLIAWLSILFISRLKKIRK